MEHSNWFYVPDFTNQEVEVFYYRKKIARPKGKCVVKISADSRYKLYVNDALVEVGPSKGNAEIWYYDEIELTHWLSLETNVIAVELRHDPTQHWGGNCGFFRTATPGLHFQFLNDMEGVKTSVWKCKKLSDYRVVKENPYFSPLMIYEEKQGNCEDHGWRKPEFDDSCWKEAKEWKMEELPVLLQPEHLQKRTIPFMKRIKRQFLNADFPICVGANEEKTIILDAGELMTGYLNLQILGGAEADISILQSECYAGEIKGHHDPFKSLPLKGDRTDTSLKLYGYADRYHVAGCGFQGCPERYEPFWFRTFRYVKLTIRTKEIPLTVLDFDYEETGYPLEVKTCIETSDEMMKKIWDICERSLRRCMHETYEDCPFYEQLQYAMDSRSQMLYTYAIAADDRLARKCMDDFRHSYFTMKKDEKNKELAGLINCSAPNYERNLIPGFSIYYIGMVYDHMMYFADAELVRKHMEAVDGILDFFERHLNKEGIVDKIGDVNQGGIWSFIDWTPEWDETDGVPSCTKQGPITMESLLYVTGLQYAAKLACFIGKNERSSAYEERAKRVQEAINRLCVGENGMYQDGPGMETYSQHCQVFAVLTGTVNEKKGRQLLEETLKNKSRYAQCSVAMMLYLFRALEMCDLYEYTEELWDIWRKMVNDHMTTCAEDPLMSRSDCHAWGALALYELPAVVLGVRPVEPGKFEVIPVKGGQKVRTVWGNVVTPTGMFSVTDL